MNSRQITEYKQLASFLSQTLGEKYEIVLHDVNGENANIIAIFNPLSKRSEYSEESEFVRDIITFARKDKAQSKGEFQIQTKEGRTLYGATFFIRDDTELVGLLCINHDKSDFEGLAMSILRLGGLNSTLSSNVKAKTNQKQNNKNIADSLSDEIMAVITQVIGYEFSSSGLMPSIDQKKEIVSILYQNGIFSIKGAIGEVARMLKISEPSVYRYMSEIKNNKKQSQLMYYI